MCVSAANLLRIRRNRLRSASTRKKKSGAHANQHRIIRTWRKHRWNAAFSHAFIWSMARRAHTISTPHPGFPRRNNRLRGKFAAVKKFLRQLGFAERFGRPNAQNARISAGDSRRSRRGRHSCTSISVARDGRETASRCSARRLKNAQTPRRFFKSSLTTCGLALPPDAFIT